jgi:imidazole glycerol-phosphate synthase subunit HisH
MSDEGVTETNYLEPYIAIVNYGMGNLHSAKKALESVSDIPVLVTQDAIEILEADRVVVPGVGAIRDCMGAIIELGLDKTIGEVINRGTPLLGICIGMQVLLSFSEENGGVDCLKYFSETARSFLNYDVVSDQHLKVPHMGWNRVEHKPHPIWEGIEDQGYFYFVHSYCAELSAENTYGMCDYGIKFSAMMAKNNVIGVQFHPEKSDKNGLQLLKNFSKWKVGAE